MSTVTKLAAPVAILFVLVAVLGCSRSPNRSPSSADSAVPARAPAIVQTPSVPVKLAAKAGQVQANGITLAYESFGPEDRETVLLIMGTGSQLTAWPTELCEELVRRGYRVIRFDNRDVGLSTRFEAVGSPDYAAIDRALKAGQPAPLPYTLDDMAIDAVGLLDALGIQQAHVVGASMGGAIAQLVAADHPEHTLSLTCIMASSGNPDLPQPKAEVFAALLAPVPPAEDWDAIASYRIKIEQAIGSPGYPTDEKLLRERAVRDAKRSWYPAGVERHALAAFVADGGSSDRRPKLQAIKAPTVVLHGADDPLVPIADGRDVAANIPGAELRVVPGMGHDIPLPLVQEFADAITAAATKAR